MRPLSALLSDRGTGGAAAGRLLTLVAVATTAILLLMAGTQIYDTNFYTLWEVPGLLAGDHPYRDFFEWGTPLAAYLSAGAQLLVGYRLIGEFALQWLFIVAGTMIAFHLGQRQPTSRAAAVTMLALTLLILVSTATYNYTKLLTFPLALWSAFRYIEKPTAGRGAALAVVAVVGFLLRHDYGIYVGAASVITLAAAHAFAPDRGSWKVIVRNVAIYAGVVLVLLAPWAAAVQAGEGFVDFVRARFLLYEKPLGGAVYGAFLRTNILEILTSWIRAPRSPAAIANSAAFLRLVTLVVPVCLLIEAVVTIRRSRSRGAGVPVDARRLIVAGVFLLIVNSSLIRQPPYFTVVAPLTAALSARYLSAERRAIRRVAVALVALAGLAAILWSYQLPLWRPADLASSLRVARWRLFASPPVSVLGPLDGNPVLSLQYLRECMAPGDRVFVIGSTPYQVSYYAERPVAGGQLDWHHGYRSEPREEQRSLELLQRQSVPFAFSTHDPVLADLKRYPRIRAHLDTHYRALEGSNGRLLVDTRRQPTRRYGDLELPCFAGPIPDP